ncbi:MAG: penicillin-binding protein activator [Thermodesulfobacteriota bacterium]
MNKKYILVLLVAGLFCASCGPISGIFKGVERPSPRQALFESAEKKFRDGEYSQALPLYRKYLEKYPATDMAPAAAMKIGMIGVERKNYEKARNAFHRLMEKYPESDFVQSAKIEVLDTYFQQGRFQEAIAYADTLSKEKLSGNQRLRARMIVGDAHMAQKAYRKAYQAFLQAFYQAGQQRRPAVGKRLMAAVSFFEPAQIEKALSRLDGKPPSGYLLYQQGVSYMAEGQIGDALAAFDDFLDRFPGHAYAADARGRIEELQSDTFFEGHTIGCLLPLSGKYQTFGRRAVRGIETALAEAGRKLDVDPPFRLIIRDTAGDSEQARRMVKALGKKRVAAIIGPIVEAPAAAEAANELGIPIITLSQKPDIIETGPYVFRNFLTPAMQVQALIDYTMGELGLERFAVLYPAESYGERFLDLFWDRLLENDGKMVGLESYNPDHTDFSEPIKKLVGLHYELPEALQPPELAVADYDAVLSAQTLPHERVRKWTGRMAGKGPGEAERRPDPLPFETGEEDEEDKEPEPEVDFDAVFIPDSPRKAGLIIPQLRYHDIKQVYLMGTNLWHSQKLIDIARYQIRKAVIPDGFFAESRKPHVQSFVKDFQFIYGQMPGFIEAVSYDSAMIACGLLARGDIGNRTDLKNGLVEMPPQEAVTGTTGFLESGEAEKDIYLLKTAGGRFVEIER